MCADLSQLLATVNNLEERTMSRFKEAFALLETIRTERDEAQSECIALGLERDHARAVASSVALHVKRWVDKEAPRNFDAAFLPALNEALKTIEEWK